MYVRLVRFTLGQGARAAAEKLADEYIPAIKAHDGCSECLFITDDDAGEYGIVVIWDSKEHAGVAAAAIGPRLSKALAEVSDKPASMQLFEVYEPK